MAQKRNEKIRNIAIIAHVDHGKTTLVDAMFKQSGVFREGAAVEERLMDSMDLEKERGITITAKNCAVSWKDVKINILDTPGHADFGGEVERALMMVDGVVLLVDSAEGPLPQTRFVLEKSLKAGLSIIVCLNKIDRSDSRSQEVLNEIYDLFIELDANDQQIEFPVVYAIGRDGIAQPSLEDKKEDLTFLFDNILEKIPGPSYDDEAPFQMMVSNLDYSEYLGRLAIGKVFNGSVKSKESLVRIDKEDKVKALRVVKVQTYQGNDLVELDNAEPGEIVVLAGLEEVEIGDTICSKESPVALERIRVDEPTIAMTFYANSSPLSGKEGKFVQSQRIGERLRKETLFNVALQVEDSPEGDAFVVKGRGELQLAILVETMRREGFELAVGRPKILYKEVDGQKHEPIEKVFIDCPEESVGSITERLSSKKGRMTNMVNSGDRSRLEFSVPSRALIGYRSRFLTDTKGTGIMSSYLEGYEAYRGDFKERSTGSLVADRNGKVIPYAIFHLEDRGKFFVKPGDVVYEGMVVGEHNLASDLNINVCKEKKLSNMRASGKDENVILTPVVRPNLERAIDFIRDDELVEVTPESVRLRKKALAANQRK